MTELGDQHWQPVSWLPAGLITWQMPGERVHALATGWMALISGEAPRLRAGWPGQRDPFARFWPGGDFVLNVPDADCLKKVRGLLDQGRACLDVAADLGLTTRPGTRVQVPCLQECLLQFECVKGAVRRDSFEPEIVGEIALLHRNGVTIEPRSIPDLCAINPFRLDQASQTF